MLLGGSWVVINGITSRVTILITHIRGLITHIRGLITPLITHVRGLITPLITTYEPPSWVSEDGPKGPKHPKRIYVGCIGFGSILPSRAKDLHKIWLYRDYRIYTACRV